MSGASQESTQGDRPAFRAIRLDALSVFPSENDDDDDDGADDDDDNDNSDSNNNVRDRAHTHHPCSRLWLGHTSRWVARLPGAR